ncbi:twitching motility protein PilT [Halanaeroarchaeum sulfurireducens]|uniref:PilT domain-containing protein n=1 Tax=Halanaeroarchaeum sulfurireducens TaxID=1604004 RepID=A0A0F7P8A6_9EURY|nr:twitching motility protein PilT [Halanaeroarchaeum sulfurireducens]AKH97391.1 PilT domain-containing protein [Halanaeroarchaeum sulfurireducens]ALG81793.1 PilT domain-containing protein [Halanaeroarchaeum sulfurireducens]
MNTTVLSNFSQVDHVELLLDLPRLVTVDAVREELEAGVETHPYVERAVAVLGDGIPVVIPSDSTKNLEEQLLESLDPGEAQALAVAAVADGTVITDDGDARTTATQRGVDLTGSIGLLVRFVEDGHISAATADEYLKRWIDEAGFRSPAYEFDVFLEE